MKVTLVPYGNIPKVTISLALRGGNIDEAQEQLGVADITGELLKEGTTTLSSKEVAEAAARMGSTLAVTVGADETTVAMDVLSESRAGRGETAGGRRRASAAAGVGDLRG